MDTGTLTGSAEVTDSVARASGSVAGTKVDPWVRAGSVESAALAGDQFAKASFVICNVCVRDKGIDYVYVKEVSGEAYASLNGETYVTVNPVEVTVLGVTYTLKPGFSITIPNVVRISLREGSTAQGGGRAEAHGGALEMEALRGILGGARVRIGGLDAVVTE